MGHLLPVVVLLIACSDLLQAARFFHLKDKTLIVEVDRKNPKSGETVTIECNTTAHTDAIDSKEIQWSKRGKTGKTLTVRVSERPDAQNYTCMLRNEVLDYTHVILYEVNLPVLHRMLKVEHAISCSIKNYSGHFTCSWNGTLDANTEFFFEAFDNNRDTQLQCENITKHTIEGHAIPSYTVSCHDTHTCHYSENPSIDVELHVLDKNRYELHKKSFTLRNIIKPDPPHDLRIENKNDFSLHWKYPKTWCNSYSFYGLVFNVKVERKPPHGEENYLNIDNTSLSLDHTDVTQFCVQARDMYHVNSYWSNWSCAKKKNKKKHKEEKDKKKKKKGKKNKKTHNTK
ncbi:interleukin-12 subunit beta isoform X2 [Dendropsophus ebraccatus]|uniref:interleukin-12 subunit beta isoform X2 n=2 Tax=Dendropsophus ebraccatus TaxID=150705 RepID=UPI0038320FE9